MSGLICALPLIAAFFSSCAGPQHLAAGYVEGEYVLVAPVETAEIEKLAIVRGDRIAPGQVLVILQKRDAEIAVAEAQAALAKARSQLENLREGKRPEEIAVVEASLRSAVSLETEARRVLERRNSLLRTGIVTQAQFDDSRTALDMAQAKVGEIRANLDVMRLSARAHEIDAAAAFVAQAQAALENAQWRLSKRQLSLNLAGTVTDILRHEGELAGPQAPVLSVLPDGAVKLRVYIAEAHRSLMTPGVRLAVHCDGCAKGMTAKVTYVSADPEFTPPVIYSLNNRQKLVYLVEAAPEAGHLAPGQIVDVSIPASGN